MSKKISFASLAMLIITAIDSIRNLPAAALFGSSLIFFFIVSAIVFLIPTALIAAELAAAFPERGGVYEWVQKAFGKKTAMVAIWLQWINTMVWYPSFLSFVAGTFAYLIHPDLIHNKIYLVSSILTIFWVMTFINLRGIYISTILNNIFATIGTIIPMFLLIGFGLFWVISGQPLQITFDQASLFPSLANTGNWVTLIAIMASFLGIELAGVHVNDVKEPQKNFPAAVATAVFFILFTMIFGSLSIAFVLPEKQISLVAGVMQVFTHFFKTFGLEKISPILTFSIGIGAMGTMINWLISPAKGLLHAAEYKFLPQVFAKTNQAGVAYNILLAQAVLVSLVSLIYFLLPSVNALYWFLTALSTELYMLMYLLMFAAAIVLHYRYKTRGAAFKIPGKNVGIWITIILGCIGCISTIIVSFFPPNNIDIGNHLHYVLMILFGNIISLLPLIFFYRVHKKALK